jgi:hypothetical protein
MSTVSAISFIAAVWFASTALTILRSVPDRSAFAVDALATSASRASERCMGLVQCAFERIALEPSSVTLDARSLAVTA